MICTGTLKDQFIELLPSKILTNLQDVGWKYKSNKCNLCSKEGSITFTHKLYPDFQVPHERDWSAKLLNAEDGICLNCGHFQRYSRLSLAELNEYLMIF